MKLGEECCRKEGWMEGRKEEMNKRMSCASVEKKICSENSPGVKN